MNQCAEKDAYDAAYEAAYAIMDMDDDPQVMAATADGILAAGSTLASTAAAAARLRLEC